MMDDESRSPSRFRTPLESALQDYERQTGIVLVDHPLAKLLGDCRSVKSVFGVLRERAPAAFGGDGDGGRVAKVLERIVSVLHKLSHGVVSGEVTSVRHKTWMGVTCL